MKKILIFIIPLFIIGCSEEENPTSSAIRCEGGAEFSEFGYSCGDLNVVQDVIDSNPSLDGVDVSEIVYATHFNIYGRLLVLHLPGRGIEYLPESIGDLSALIDLDLENNQLKTIPSEIGSLGNLTELNLMDNKLTSIPESICDLPSDCSIGIRGNKLCDRYNYECISYWEISDYVQDQTNCCDIADDSGNTIDNYTECYDDDGNCLVELDECGVCGALDGCDIPIDNIYITEAGLVLFNTSQHISGMQFNINGDAVITDAQNYEFDYFISDFNQNAFIIIFPDLGPACGALVELTIDGNFNGVENLIVAGNENNELEFNYYEDCSTND